ncbi:hypothetical protein J6590_060985 [Homalodisca vitripennis]|nr:hypothetical protein J6590_060985 [Homalodisca vitripennis]
MAVHCFPSAPRGLLKRRNVREETKGSLLLTGRPTLRLYIIHPAHSRFYINDHPTARSGGPPPPPHQA